MYTCDLLTWYNVGLASSVYPGLLDFHRYFSNKWSAMIL